MGKLGRIAAVASVSVLLLGGAAMVAPGASGSHHHHHHDVSRSGTCSVAGRWRLELDDMMMMDRIGVHFEIWSATGGQVWKVRLADNGTVFSHGPRMMGRYGHFMIYTWARDQSGTDRIVARGVNRATGEVCRGVASI
jgi:hypothetical protein